MLFDNWYELLRVVIAGTAGYIALIAILRISGKRTLSKMNAFDLVITVTIGSTYATLILNKDVSLAEGVLAFAVLAGLQYAMSWISVRSKWFEDLIKSEPTLIYYKGKYLNDVMRHVRVTKTEVLQALRDSGKRIENVEFVIMETDGTLSVVPASEEEDAEKILSDVRPQPSEVDK